MVYLLGLNADQFQPFRKPWAVGLANRLNLQTLPRHADQVLIAAGTYQGIFTIASPLFWRYFIREKFDKFDARTQTNLNVRVVSFIQAVFICAKALSVIFTDTSRRTTTAQQRLWGYSTPAGEVQAWASGYFLWDMYVSARYYEWMGPESMIHAVCAFFITMIGFVSCSFMCLTRRLTLYSDRSRTSTV